MKYLLFYKHLPSVKSTRTAVHFTNRDNLGRAVHKEEQLKRKAWFSELIPKFSWVVFPTTPLKIKEENTYS